MKSKDKAKSDTKPEAADEPKKARTISEGVRDSWKDPVVRAKRSTRNGVKANGAEYTSVYKAFQALRLPVSKHIAFRIKLKEAGKLDFTDGKNVVKFELI